MRFSSEPFFHIQLLFYLKRPLKKGSAAKRPWDLDMARGCRTQHSSLSWSCFTFCWYFPLWLFVVGFLFGNGGCSGFSLSSSAATFFFSSSSSLASWALPQFLAQCLVLLQLPWKLVRPSQTLDPTCPNKSNERLTNSLGALAHGRVWIPSGPFLANSCGFKTCNMAQIPIQDLAHVLSSRSADVLQGVPGNLQILAAQKEPSQFDSWTIQLNMTKRTSVAKLQRVAGLLSLLLGPQLGPQLLPDSSWFFWPFLLKGKTCWAMGFPMLS